MTTKNTPWEDKIKHNILEGALDHGDWTDYKDDETKKKGWKILSGSVDYKSLNDDDRKTLQEMAYTKYHTDPIAHGIITAYMSFVIGKGINYISRDENEDVQRYIDAFWKNPENRWDLRSKEFVKRGLRDGEVFLRWFKTDSGLVCRFIEPSKIVKIEYKGEGTAEADVETPTVYHREYKDSSGTSKVEPIPAEQIQHIKLGADSDEQRGRPFIEVIMKSLARYEAFARDRAMINRGRSCFVLEKIVDGSPESVSSNLGGMSTPQGGGSSQYSKRMPKSGSVVVHNKAIEYKFQSLNINADDAKEDGRLFRLFMACAMQMPEYMFGDASNANYASTMVAESPFVRRCEDLQEFFRFHFKEIFARVIKHGIATGKLPEMSNELVLVEGFALHIKLWKKFKSFFHLRESVRETYVTEDDSIYKKEACPTKINVDIEFPPLVHRDIQQETSAMQIHNAMGWASAETISSKLGYDYLEEKRKIAQEDSEGKGEGKPIEDELTADGKDEPGTEDNAKPDK